MSVDPKTDGLLLSFRVGAFRFCVPIVEVETILMVPAFRSLPGVSGSVTGVFSYRNRIVKIVCLRRKFGAEPPHHPADGQLILTELRTGLTGFRVDAVLDIVSPGPSPPQSVSYLCGLTAFHRVIPMGAGLFIRTDFEQLWRTPDVDRKLIRNIHPMDTVRSAEGLPEFDPMAEQAAWGDEVTPAVLSMVEHPRHQWAGPRPGTASGTDSAAAPAAGRSSASGPSANRPGRSRGRTAGRSDRKAESMHRLKAKGCGPSFAVKKGGGLESGMAPGGPVPRSYRFYPRRLAAAAAALAALVLIVFGLKSNLDRPEMFPLSAPTTASASVDGGRALSPDAAAATPNRFSSKPASAGGNGGEPPLNESAAETKVEMLRIDTDQFTLIVERPVVAAYGSRTGKTGLSAPAASASGDTGTAADGVYKHIVVAGDTLWDIAAKHLGDPFRYPELAELSRINDPDWIYPGDMIRIYKKHPAPPHSEKNRYGRCGERSHRWHC